MKLPDAMTVQEAATKGFMYPLAGLYAPSEYWMLENVIKDMNRGRIPFAIVIEHADYPAHLSIYRKGVK
jgi:hypothetical protein